MLLFDPYAGHIATVRGDLDTAKDVVTYVTGVGHGYDVYGNPYDSIDPGYAERKTRKYSILTRQDNIMGELASQGGSDTVTIAWVGYHPPATVLQPATAMSRRAENGADDLARFFEGLDVNAPGRDVNHSVFAHSYGSVLTGRSIRYHGLGRYADRVFFIGSPGVDVDNASEMSSNGYPIPEIYTMMAPNDPIKYVPDWIHGERASDVKEWTRLDHFDASGHSKYFVLDSTALEELILVALNGRPERNQQNE